MAVTPRGEADPPDTSELAGWSFPQVEPFDEPTEPAAPALADDLLDLSAEPLAETYAVPRRSAPSTPPVSPIRAVAGALVAVAGVLLGIGALLWATEAPGGSPAVVDRTQAAVVQSAEPLATSPAAASPVTSPVASAPSAVTAPAPVVQASSPAPSAVPTRLSLTVLNNSRITGLADRAAARFRAGGWPVKETGNFRGSVTETTVYYAPGQLDSARLLARSFSGLTRVRPRFDALPGSGLTVVLTRDYAA